MNVDLARIRAVCGPLQGLPYRAGGRGPDAYDCYGLAIHLQRELAGREMDDVEIPEDVAAQARLLRKHPSRRKWHAVERPVHLGLVEMTRTAVPHHLGVYLAVDGGGVFHAAESVGVSFDRMPQLRTLWHKLAFHDWNG